MVNEDLIKYLKEGKNRGFDFYVLKEKLVEAGFNEKDINDAKNALKKHEDQENKIKLLLEKKSEKTVVPIENSPKKKVEIHWFNISIIVGCLVALGIIAYLFFAIMNGKIDANSYGLFIIDLLKNIFEKINITILVYIIIALLLIGILSWGLLHFGIVKKLKSLEIKSINFGQWIEITLITLFVILIVGYIIMRIMNL